MSFDPNDFPAELGITYAPLVLWANDTKLSLVFSVAGSQLVGNIGGDTLADIAIERNGSFIKFTRLLGSGLSQDYSGSVFFLVLDDGAAMFKFAGIFSESKDTKTYSWSTDYALTPPTL